MNWQTTLIQRLIHLNESLFFYPKLKKFYRTNLKQDEVRIIDVGANKGQTADFFLRLYPKSEIHAFEPNEKLFGMLQSKFKRNDSIFIYNHGISNFNGQLPFSENILDETSTFEELNPESEYLRRKAKLLGVSVAEIIIDTYPVAVTRLSDYIKKKQQYFDVVKIDVEGHELQCLQGLFDFDGKLPVRFIQIESHNDDMYRTNNQIEIEKLLNTNHFRRVAKISHGFGDFHELIYEYSIR